MKKRVSLGWRTMTSAALVAAVFCTVPQAHATIDAPTVKNIFGGGTSQLYRARAGNVEQGEIVGRFYIERNIVEAATVLGITDDADPDGDGWALVGHTDADNDSKMLTFFWVDAGHIPHLLLNGRNAQTCAQLTPISMDVVVADGEDRLLRLEDQRTFCPRPVLITIPETGNPTYTETETPEQVVVDQPEPQPEAQAEPAVIVVTEQPVNQIVQPAVVTPMIDVALQAPEVKHVAGVTTVKSPNYFGTPGQKTTDVEAQSTNIFLVGGAITLVLLTGIVLIIRFAGMFSS